MNRIRFNIQVSLIALWIISLSTGSFASPKQFQHVSLELISDVETIQPETPFHLGVRFKLQKDWHLYWQNPGDAGMAPVFQWVLPDGFTMTDVQWPVPQRIIEKDIATYVYKKEVVLQIVVTPPGKQSVDSMNSFSVKIDWLLCNDICVAGNGKLELELKSGLSERRLSNWAGSLKNNNQAVPEDFPSQWQVAAGYSETHLKLTVFPNSGSVLTLYPLTQSLILNTAPNTFKPIVQHRNGRDITVFQLHIPLDPLRGPVPEYFEGVLTARLAGALDTDNNSLRAFKINVQLETGADFSGGIK